MGNCMVKKYAEWQDLHETISSLTCKRPPNEVKKPHKTHTTFTRERENTNTFYTKFRQPVYSELFSYFTYALSKSEERNMFLQEANSLSLAGLNCPLEVFLSYPCLCRTGKTWNYNQAEISSENSCSKTHSETALGHFFVV